MTKPDLIEEEMSSATLRNWWKMWVVDVSDKWTKRANKRFSKKQFIPQEYVRYEDIILQAYKCFFAWYTIKEILYSLCLNLCSNIKNSYINEELEQWNINSICDELVSYKILNYEWDLLWWVYQSLLTEWEKNKKGSYYTPDFVVKNQIKDFFKDGDVVLDPCCWTWQYLINIPSSNPLNIWGCDSDELAVRIARINLMLKYPNDDFLPNIFNIDSLALNSIFSNKIQNDFFDLIVTNPPWWAKISNEYQGYHIKSWESFSYFIERWFSLLKKWGILSYILPESILNVKSHSDIRGIMLNYDILSIYELGKIFTWVFTDVIRIDIRKEKEDWIIDIYSNWKTHTCPKIDFKSNTNFTFSIHIKQEDNEIIEKLYAKQHIFLDNENSDWALWIVTWNNKKYLSDTLDDGFIPIYTWKEVAPYRLLPAKKFLLFTPDKFQQVAQLEKYYAKPKLIYKFISKKLIFSLDEEGVFTLNSANILIPQIDYPIKVIAVLLNSKLYQDVYEKKFNSLKILKSQIQELPLPILNNDEYSEIETLFDKFVNNEVSKDFIDAYIFKLLIW